MQLWACLALVSNQQGLKLGTCCSSHQHMHRASLLSLNTAQFILTVGRGEAASAALDGALALHPARRHSQGEAVCLILVGHWA